jgi:16S rRNA processing protein RimM
VTQESPTRLLAGEIGKPHGISGEVYVVPISDDPRRFQAGSTLLWEDRSLVVEATRPHGNRFLVKFEGIETRDQAETLRGPLYVPIEEARNLEEGEFWQHDLVGCEVVSSDGHPAGTVTQVVTGAAHDLLVVATSGGDRMIPLVKDIVVSVDPEARKIVVDPPAGLLD